MTLLTDPKRNFQVYDIPHLSTTDIFLFSKHIDPQIPTLVDQHVLGYVILCLCAYYVISRFNTHKLLYVS